MDEHHSDIDEAIHSIKRKLSYGLEALKNSRNWKVFFSTYDDYDAEPLGNL